MHMKIYSNLVIYVNKEKIHLPPPHSDETICYIQPEKARLVRVDYRGGETYCHLKGNLVLLVVQLEGISMHRTNYFHIQREEK